MSLAAQPRDEHGHFISRISLKPDPNWAESAAFAFRVKQLLRAYRRHLRLGRKPTTIESSLMKRAAALTCRFEFVSVDPNVTPAEVADLERLASRARGEMLRMITGPPEPTPSLQQLMADAS